MSEEHGELAGDNWSGSITSDDGCRGRSLSWDMVYSVCASNEKSHDYDEIPPGGETNRWQFDMHFSDRPKNMLEGWNCGNQDAKTYQAWPYSFESVVRVQDQDYDQVWISNPWPRDGDDSENSNKAIGFALSILGASGNYYASIGAAIGSYVLSSNNDPVNVTGGDKKRTFDIDLEGGHDDLPRVGTDDNGNDEIKAGQVSLRVHNDYSSEGENGKLEFLPSYTFGYNHNDTTYCRGCAKEIKFKKTTPESSIFPTFKSAKPD